MLFLIQIGGLDVTVSRNFFGRQINSFETDVQLKDSLLSTTTTGNNNVENTDSTFHGVFIRAPAVVSCNNEKVC